MYIYQSKFLRIDSKMEGGSHYLFSVLAYTILNMLIGNPNSPLQCKYAFFGMIFANMIDVDHIGKTIGDTEGGTPFSVTASDMSTTISHRVFYLHFLLPELMTIGLLVIIFSEKHEGAHLTSFMWGFVLGLGVHSIGDRIIALFSRYDLTLVHILTYVALVVLLLFFKIRKWSSWNFFVCGLILLLTTLSLSMSTQVIWSIYVNDEGQISEIKTAYEVLMGAYLVIYFLSTCLILHMWDRFESFIH